MIDGVANLNDFTHVMGLMDLLGKWRDIAVFMLTVQEVLECAVVFLVVVLVSGHPQPS